MVNPGRTAQEAMDIWNHRQVTLAKLEGRIPPYHFNMIDFSAWRDTRTPIQIMILMEVAGMRGPPSDFYAFIPRWPNGYRPGLAGIPKWQQDLQAAKEAAKKKAPRRPSLDQKIAHIKSIIDEEKKEKAHKEKLAAKPNQLPQSKKGTDKGPAKANEHNASKPRPPEKPEERRQPSRIPSPPRRHVKLTPSQQGQRKLTPSQQEQRDIEQAILLSLEEQKKQKTQGAARSYMAPTSSSRSRRQPSPPRPSASRPGPKDDRSGNTSRPPQPTRPNAPTRSPNPAAGSRAGPSIALQRSTQQPAPRQNAPVRTPQGRPGDPGYYSMERQRRPYGGPPPPAAARPPPSTTARVQPQQSRPTRPAPPAPPAAPPPAPRRRVPRPAVPSSPRRTPPSQRRRDIPPSPPRPISPSSRSRHRRPVPPIPQSRSDQRQQDFTTTTTTTSRRRRPPRPTSGRVPPPPPPPGSPTVSPGDPRWHPPRDPDGRIPPVDWASPAGERHYRLYPRDPVTGEFLTG